MGRKWKKEEKEKLRQMLADGTPLPEIVIPGRNYEGIWHQARKLNLVALLRNPPLTDKQKEKLRELRNQGFSAQQIAGCDLLGPPRRTENAIYKVCSELGIVDENRSRAAKKRKVWLAGEREKFLVFLRRHSSTLASEQIAKRFGLSKGTVANLQRRLDIKPSLQETLALPHVRKKFQRIYQRRSQKKFADFEARILERQKELEVLAQKMREKRRTVPLEEKRCINCRYSWPRHQKFFYYSTVRTRGLTARYFYGRCKICVAKQRHQKNLQKRRQKCRR